MTMLSAFLACIVAGFINGSYAFPVKHMHNLKKETIWFYFSFIGFLIVPIVAITILNPHALSILGKIPFKYFSTLIGGGFVFGIGMVLFTLCLNRLGMGIAFVLNISLGTMGGSLLPLFFFHSNTFNTLFGQINLMAFLLFLVSVCISTYGIHLRDKNKSNQLIQKNTLLGFILGVLSGLFCAMQGFAYAYSLSVFKSMAFLNGVSPYISVNIPWLVILASAFFPYAGFQLYLQIKQHSFVNIFEKYYFKNIKWLLLMGVLYFSSLLIYTKAIVYLGNYGQILAWPLFMIFIILSSNFWSLIQGEWKATSLKSKSVFSAGIFIIIFAIILLGYAASIRNV